MSAAATHDPRFPPVSPDEPLLIEISILSPFFPIRPEEVRVGLHGLHVRLGDRSGLLLPQVAVEWGWDAPTFLERTCRKAGLSADAWRAAELRAFTAEHFGDPN